MASSCVVVAVAVVVAVVVVLIVAVVVVSAVCRQLEFLHLLCSVGLRLLCLLSLHSIPPARCTCTVKPG